MLNILIVDDEILIREGLSKMISKQSEYFHVAGICSNGREALDLLAAAEIDLVITDIRMPEISGLDLIREVKALYPQVRCILMSGFTEFNYAREAIRYSAVDYLLKPIDKEQLFGLLHQLAAENRERCERERRLRLQLLSAYLHSDALDEASPPEFALPLPYYAVCVHRAGDADILQAGSERMRMIAGPDADCLVLQPLVQLWIGYFPEEPGPETLREFYKPLLAGNGKVPVHLGTSLPRMLIRELKSAYAEASRACRAGLYREEPHYYGSFRDLNPQPEPASPALLAADWKDFTESLQLLNLERIEEWLRGQFSRLKELQAEPEDILRFCRRIEDEVIKEFPEMPVFTLEAQDLLEKSLLACMTFREMEQTFLAALLPPLEHIRSMRSDLGGKAVENVKRWIASHYNEHADLNFLAGMVFLTPSYLSKLFKQETGLTLTEYITEIRIKKAKQLLRQEPNMKVHTIGAEVGYPDPAYFNKLFKRIVGVTPNEYKKIMP